MQEVEYHGLHIHAVPLPARVQWVWGSPPIGTVQDARTGDGEDVRPASRPSILAYQYRYY